MSENPTKSRPDVDGSRPSWDLAKLVVSGALISFGLVGFFTGLLLVPVGVWLATTVRPANRSWPGLILGLGLGPVALLSDDLTKADPPSMAVPVFWVGLILSVTGAVGLIWQGTSGRSPAER